MRGQLAAWRVTTLALTVLLSACAHTETAPKVTGHWEKRIVGQGSGCSGGVLPFDPTGSPCYPAEKKFGANCYYFPTENGNQLAFSCLVTQ